MGFRGHGTEDIHTFRVRHGDMGTQVGKGTWDMATQVGEGDMGFRVTHGDIHHMGTWGLGDITKSHTLSKSIQTDIQKKTMGLGSSSAHAPGKHRPLEPPGTFICNMRTNLPANHAHNEIPTSRSKSTPML